MTSRVGFVQAARMEWIKLRSLRSLWWTLAVILAGAVAIAVAVGHNSHHASSDVTNNVLAGVAPGVLLFGVLGVLTMTSEYTSGLIRATLAAVPRRGLLLAAKAAVFGATALVAAEATAFLSFAAGTAALPAAVPAPSLTEPAVLRAVILSGAGLTLVGLFGLGLGVVIRHSGAALAVFAGLVFAIGQIVLALSPAAARFVPVALVGDSLAVVTPGADSLSPWAGLGALSLYAVISLGLGGWLLRRRDA